MKTFLFIWLGVCAGYLIGVNVMRLYNPPVAEVATYCMEDAHLRMGEIVDKYKETVDGDKFYYVVIAGKIDGKYHTRDIQVNKWMWIHTYRIGDYWSPSV